MAARACGRYAQKNTRMHTCTHNTCNSLLEIRAQKAKSNKHHQRDADIERVPIVHTHCVASKALCWRRKEEKDEEEEEEEEEEEAKEEEEEKKEKKKKKKTKKKKKKKRKKKKKELLI